MSQTSAREARTIIKPLRAGRVDHSTNPHNGTIGHRSYLIFGIIAGIVGAARCRCSCVWELDRAGYPDIPWPGANGVWLMRATAAIDGGNVNMYNVFSTTAHALG